MAARAHVLVIDRLGWVHNTLVALATAGARLEVVARALEVADAADLAARTSPDVLIVNLPVDSQPAIDAIRKLHRALPANRIIALASHLPPGFMRAAIDSGAACVLSKDDDSESLLEAIQAVRADKTYASPACTRQMLHDVDQPESQESSPLTKREWEVLELICEGLTSRAISGRLGIEPSTVHAHRANIMKKLNLHKVPLLVIWHEQHRDERP